MMPTGYKLYPMILGNTLQAHIAFMKDLKSKLNVCEVSRLAECDAIIAFVPIVSRAGTDIEAALQKIPSNYPVILVVLHYTYDVYQVVPDSSFSIHRSDVFPVDCLYYDTGLLDAQCNKRALRAVMKTIQHIRKDDTKENTGFNQRAVVGNLSPNISWIIALLNIVLIVWILTPTFSVVFLCIFAIILHTGTAFVLTNTGHERLIPVIFVVITLGLLIVLWRETVSSDQRISNSVHGSGESKAEDEATTFREENHV